MQITLLTMLLSKALSVESRVVANRVNFTFYELESIFCSTWCVQTQGYSNRALLHQSIAVALSLSLHLVHKWLWRKVATVCVVSRRKSHRHFRCVGGKDRVRFHLTWKDIFEDAFWKASSRMMYIFQRKCATRWTVSSAYGRVDFRLTFPIAVSHKANRPCRFQNIEHCSCWVCFIARNYRIFWKSATTVKVSHDFEGLLKEER